MRPRKKKEKNEEKEEEEKLLTILVTKINKKSNTFFIFFLLFSGFWIIESDYVTAPQINAPLLLTENLKTQTKFWI